MLGKNRHEGQAELPHAEARRLWISVGVGRLEDDLQPMAVERFHPVDEGCVNQLGPIGAELQVHDGVDREDEVIRRHVPRRHSRRRRS